MLMTVELELRLLADVALCLPAVSASAPISAATAASITSAAAMLSAPSHSSGSVYLLSRLLPHARTCFVSLPPGIFAKQLAARSQQHMQRTAPALPPHLFFACECAAADAHVLR